MSPPGPSITHPVDRPERPPARDNRPPQFSVASLMALVTLVAVAFALTRIMPTFVEIVAALVLACVVPICIGTLAFYCRGYRRTFFAAAFASLLLPLAIVWDRSPFELSDGEFFAEIAM